jgi:hypothetical protein
VEEMLLNRVQLVTFNFKMSKIEFRSQLHYQLLWYEISQLKMLSCSNSDYFLLSKNIRNSSKVKSIKDQAEILRLG